MTLDEAKAECERWFAYLERQKEKSLALQKLASERRAGTIDEQEARRRIRSFDSGVTVYDGANLERAVRTLLRHSPRDRGREDVRIVNSKETFDILVPSDGRDGPPDVYFDGKSGDLLRQTKQPGQPYAILTYACGDRRPKRIIIEFRD